MSLELNPVGVACNLACEYCYEKPMRDAGNYSSGYDLDAMKRGLEAEGGPFTLFGGDPLLMKIEDLAEILRWGFDKHGYTGVQTNGALITSAHVDLFTRYKTHVGLSLDGPDELNDSRWAGTLEKTRGATAASFAAMDRLLAAGIVPSLIVTLYRGNATAERLPKLLTWLQSLDERGVHSVRIHALEVDSEHVRREMALTDDENVHAFVSLMHLQDSLQKMRFDIFTDMVHLLLGTGTGSCVWNACDPLTTPAVRGVSGTGGRTNCSRTNKDGVDWVKADAHGNERYLVLHATPQADGGCQDCRFFFACKGQCPGTAINGDWRNRSEQCPTWFRLFEEIERQLVMHGKAPISRDAARRAAAEAAVLSGQGTNRQHGDHWDAPDGHEHADGAYVVHGDAGTTTMHGDHSDA